MGLTLRASLCAIVVAAGCGRVGFGINGDATVTDAADDAATDAPIDALALGPWSAPQPLTTINALGDVGDPSVTEDRLELFFLTTQGGPGHNIWHATRTQPTDAWGAPSEVVALNGFIEESPEISSDGLTIYFVSSRGGDFDVYTATRVDRSSMFSVPVFVPALSSSVIEANLALSADGLVAVVDRFVSGTDREMFMVRRATPADPWGPGLQLTELSTPVTDGMPSLDTHGLTLVFASTRMGDNDLYETQRATPADPFAPPQVIGELDAVGVNQNDPFVTADLLYIVYVIDAQLYEASR